MAEYTGSRMDLVRLLDSDDEKLMDDLCGWQFATVARVLAEAGAVHPAVHTPNRVAQWLAGHGWQPAGPFDPERLAALWVHADSDERLFLSQHPDVADYASFQRYGLAGAARVAGVALPQALLEIALLPDEVTW